MTNTTCPVTMNTHKHDGPTCDRCDRMVREHLAWFLARPAADQERITRGAWMANDVTHWRAMELHNA